MKMFTWSHQPLAKCLSVIRVFFAAVWIAESKDEERCAGPHSNWGGSGAYLKGAGWTLSAKAERVALLAFELYRKWLPQIRAQGSLGEFLPHHESFPVIMDEKNDKSTQRPWNPGFLLHTTPPGVPRLPCFAEPTDQRRRHVMQEPGWSEPPEQPGTALGLRSFTSPVSLPKQWWWQVNTCPFLLLPSLRIAAVKDNLVLPFYLESASSQHKRKAGAWDWEEAS